MRYTGEICSYCGMEFTDEDDVVVCPECATPHHRVCWLAHGECANASKHGTDFVWVSSPAQAEAENEQEGALTPPDRICPECGTARPHDMLSCPECGAPISDRGNPLYDTPLAQFAYGFDPDEPIGDITSGEIALYCRSAGASYIKKFRRLAGGSKLAFNWAAFLFAPYWFFYRKLYKAAAIFAALFFAVSVWTLPIMANVNDIYGSMAVEYQRMLENGDESAALTVLEGRMEELSEAMKPMALPSAITVLLKVVSGFAANLIYYKKARSDIHSVRRKTDNKRSFQLEIFRCGGTNIFFGSGSYLVFELLLTAVSHLMTL